MSNPNFIGAWGQTPQQQWPQSAPVVLGTPWPAHNPALPQQSQPQFQFPTNPGFENPAVPEHFADHQRSRAWSTSNQAHVLGQEWARQQVMHQQQLEQWREEEKRRQKKLNKDKQGWSHLSKKTPELHPILALDTVQIYWDIRKKPSIEIHQAAFHTNKDDPVFREGGMHMRLFSKQMPWSIDLNISSAEHDRFKVLMVWDAVHKMMQQEILDSEWALISQDRKLKERIQKSWAERTRGRSDKKLKRIDWLGDSTMFRGIERDDEFIRAHRLRLGDTLMSYDYVLKFCE